MTTRDAGKKTVLERCANAKAEAKWHYLPLNERRKGDMSNKQKVKIQID